MKKQNKYYYEMNPTILNVLSVVWLIAVVLVTLIIIKIANIKITFTETSFSIMLMVLIPYLFFHEILHSIGYVVNGASFKRITYGIHLEKGILCCSCKQEISKRNIYWSLMYPFIFIGIITYIISLIFNFPILLMLSIFNIAGCIGDLIMFYDFTKLGDLKFFEYDNPLAFGIITTENLDNKKLFGLQRIEEKDFSQTIDKKITISKTSVIVIILYYVIGIINILL